MQRRTHLEYEFVSDHDKGRDPQHDGHRRRPGGYGSDHSPGQARRQGIRPLATNGLLAGAGPGGPEIGLTGIRGASDAGVDERAAEDAPAIVASVFAAPGDTVRADPWDGPLVTLTSVSAAVACLRVYGLSRAAAANAAVTLDLPLPLTKRGCVVYATKDPGC